MAELGGRIMGRALQTSRAVKICEEHISIYHEAEAILSLFFELLTGRIGGNLGEEDGK